MKEDEALVLRAQVAELRTRLARAIKLGRAAYMHSFHNIDDAQECLDELAQLEKILP